jgi:hypothetical protein
MRRGRRGQIYDWALILIGVGLIAGIPFVPSATRLGGVQIPWIFVAGIVVALTIGIRSERARRAPKPWMPDLVVYVASFLGVAIVGGIIGNRADAGLVAATKRALRAGRLFRSVRARWSAHAKSEDSVLHADEAEDAAVAAAFAGGWPTAGLRVLGSRQENDGTWIVYLEIAPSPHQTECLRVRVPSGDPARATILITPDPPMSGSR